MKTLAILLLFCCAWSFKLQAQQVFIPNGKITFEKKINMYRTLANLDLAGQAKETMEKYRISNWEVIFDRTRSLYKAKKKENEADNLMFFFSPGESENELYADYSNKTRIIKKNIMGTNYLFKDTIPNVKWKIMHDMRSISGYECRKAIGRINDTVYVVAFYTDEILLKGGPEGFSGLPGMILGLAIPRYNTTWFATKVEAFTTNEIIPPVKGKTTENKKDLKKLTELSAGYKEKIFGFLL